MIYVVSSKYRIIEHICMFDIKGNAFTCPQVLFHCQDLGYISNIIVIHANDFVINHSFTNHINLLYQKAELYHFHFTFKGSENATSTYLYYLHRQIQRHLLLALQAYRLCSLYGGVGRKHEPLSFCRKVFFKIKVVLLDEQIYTELSFFHFK